MEPQDYRTNWFVTKNGIRISEPMDEAAARAEAARLQRLCESDGETAAFNVVQLILG